MDHPADIRKYKFMKGEQTMNSHINAVEHASTQRKERTRQTLGTSRSWPSRLIRELRAALICLALIVAIPCQITLAQHKNSGAATKASAEKKASSTTNLSKPVNGIGGGSQGVPSKSNNGGPSSRAYGHSTGGGSQGKPSQISGRTTPNSPPVGAQGRPKPQQNEVQKVREFQQESTQSNLQSKGVDRPTSVEGGHATSDARPKLHGPNPQKAGAKKKTVVAGSIESPKERQHHR